MAAAVPADMAAAVAAAGAARGAAAAGAAGRRQAAAASMTRREVRTAMGRMGMVKVVRAEVRRALPLACRPLAA